MADSADLFNPCHPSEVEIPSTGGWHSGVSADRDPSPGRCRQVIQALGPARIMHELRHRSSQCLPALPCGRLRPVGTGSGSTRQGFHGSGFGFRLWREPACARKPLREAGGLALARIRSRASAGESQAAVEARLAPPERRRACVACDEDARDWGSSMPKLSVAAGGRARRERQEHAARLLPPRRAGNRPVRIREPRIRARFEARNAIATDFASRNRR